MAQAGTEPREMEFEKLITHLEILEETASEQKNLRVSKKVKEPIVKMTRSEVIRGQKMDPPLIPKLEIKVVTSARSSRVKIILRGKPIIRNIASIKTTSKVS